MILAKDVLTPTPAPNPDPGESSQSPYPIVRPEPVDISHLDPTKPTVALTWDDGPHPTVDLPIIDALNKQHQKGTFFLVGLHIRNTNRDSLPLYTVGGHEIGNHSFNHPMYNTLTTEDIQKEIGTTDQLIHSLTGAYPTILRAPGGNLPKEKLPHEERSFVHWSIDPHDYRKDMTADSIHNYIASRIKDGDVVLLHSLFDRTRQASIQLIDELSAQGYQLVTMSELKAFKAAYR